MDERLALLEHVKNNDLARGRLLGLLHLLIGRRIQLADETTVCPGLTWREAASLLKRVRWDREAVRDLGLDPASLPPRDRERYWYLAIAQARVDSPAAVREGDELARLLERAGYVVRPAPSSSER